MAQFEVSDDVAVLVERFSGKKPFESLSFNDALLRILSRLQPPSSHEQVDLESLLSDPSRSVIVKKAQTPSVTEWVASIPELSSKRGLNSWKAVCDVLKIEVAGDSARRKLKNWVRHHKPLWPSVPEA